MASQIDSSGGGTTTAPAWQSGLKIDNRGAINLPGTSSWNLPPSSNVLQPTKSTGGLKVGNAGQINPTLGATGQGGGQIQMPKGQVRTIVQRPFAGDWAYGNEAQAQALQNIPGAPMWALPNQNTSLPGLAPSFTLMVNQPAWQNSPFVGDWAYGNQTSYTQPQATWQRPFAGDWAYGNQTSYTQPQATWQRPFAGDWAYGDQTSYTQPQAAAPSGGGGGGYGGYGGGGYGGGGRGGGGYSKSAWAPDAGLFQWNYKG